MSKDFLKLDEHVQKLIMLSNTEIKNKIIDELKDKKKYLKEKLLEHFLQTYGLLYDSDLNDFVIVNEKILIDYLSKNFESYSCIHGYPHVKDTLCQGYFEDFVYFNSHIDNFFEEKINRHLEWLRNNVCRAILDEFSKHITEEEIMNPKLWAKYYDEQNKSVNVELKI